MEYELIRKSQAFSENVFRDRTFENRPFHNIAHTCGVVDAAIEIGTHID
ncbi:MAG: hypothetical protein ABIR06_15750 [Cyclobacteriaceae bacterium]